MRDLCNLFISDNILLKKHNLLYLSLVKLYGVNKYRANIITSLNNTSTYKPYSNIQCKYHIYFTRIFNNITFNINNFKKKGDLYNKIKREKLI